MALSEKHRSSLYRSLAPLVGAEETEAMLSQFPVSDLDTPATRDFVRAEIGDLRREIDSRFDDVRDEIATLRVDLARELHRMTVWFAGALVGSVVGGTGVAVGIASMT